jgi:hypothetical protein
LEDNMNSNQHLLSLYSVLDRVLMHGTHLFHLHVAHLTEKETEI